MVEMDMHEARPRLMVCQPVVGIAFMQVCAEADVTDEEILTFCNQTNPSGTQGGWMKVYREETPVHQAPTQCQSYPDRRHFMVSC